MAVKYETPLPRLRTLINNAELSWFKVYDSSADRKVIRVNGDEYAQLPQRFSTRSKVLAYFKQYWSCPISKTLFCNLKSIVYKGRLYVIVGDPGPVPFQVVSLLVKNETSSYLTVRASLSGDADGNQIVYYRIQKRKNGKLIITKRLSAYPDYRYMACR
ncbi:DL-endopeptidase inhibitor IseA family protein [Paenibacillus gorillae]|uniref:DL-endopeptidase inhibitor IseA family protein n=1 Tax=Paenibacillus gorillae TaxID=1243662 RepID=UPI0004B0E67C|nr:DL-endopeptidase inhibitor IseA family protein [Paenibacillus gorillae]